jgi:hypothetical protein
VETVTTKIAKPEHQENQIEKPEMPKHEPISLSSLKKSRTPDAQKIADLRALLQKVVPQQNTNAQPQPAVQPQPAAQPQPAVQPIASNTATEPAQKPIENKDTSTKMRAENPKEVPEDVLRSILSS